ncbi:MAG: hypothetical protein GF344_03690 [Chitinivibrionales bacterium]|nr:hypothetical protein [Chitinivibrionales bacterium]
MNPFAVVRTVVRSPQWRDGIGNRLSGRHGARSVEKDEEDATTIHQCGAAEFRPRR